MRLGASIRAAPESRETDVRAAAASDESVKPVAILVNLIHLESSNSPRHQRCMITGLIARLTTAERDKVLSLVLHNARTTDRGNHNTVVAPSAVRMVVLVYFKSGEVEIWTAVNHSPVVDVLCLEQ